MNDLDVVVSFDTTGSMFPALAEVRRRVEQFITDLFNTVPNLRIGLIAHGDYNDVYETKVIDLTTDKNVLIKFVRTVEETYGFGNGGELYEKVIHDVRFLNWQAERRVFVMLGDEPAHYKGKMVRSDSYLSHTLVEYDWKEEVNQLRDSGIKMYPVRCLNRSDSVQFHNDLARLNEVPLLKLQQFSNIIPFLTGLVYKQESDERLEAYGKELQDQGKLDRGLAEAFNLLLNATSLIGGDLLSQPADLEAVDPTRFQMLHVDTDTPIKDFVTNNGARFKIGRGFYELTKPETIQEGKEVVLRNSAGDMFSGVKAREMIGLPYGQRGKVRPLPNLGYTVFVQSTSPNRKLMGHTRFLYETEGY